MKKETFEEFANFWENCTLKTEKNDEETIQRMKDELLPMLESGVVRLAFAKVDGSHRAMLASLSKDVVIFDGKKTERTHEPNPDVQVVYDIDSMGWRSFRWDSLIHYDKN